MLKLHVADERFASVSVSDDWAEKGEAGRWDLKFPAMESAKRTRQQDTVDPRAIDQRSSLTGSAIQSRRLMG